MKYFLVPYNSVLANFTALQIKMELHVYKNEEKSAKVKPIYNKMFFKLNIFMIQKEKNIIDEVLAQQKPS